MTPSANLLFMSDVRNAARRAVACFSRESHRTAFVFTKIAKVDEDAFLSRGVPGSAVIILGSYVFVEDTFEASSRRECRLNVAPMDTKSHGPAKSEGDTRRRSARVQASWQRKDAMDVFGSSKARAPKSDGEHRFLVMLHCGCIG